MEVADFHIVCYLRVQQTTGDYVDCRHSWLWPFLSTAILGTGAQGDDAGSVPSLCICICLHSTTYLLPWIHLCMRSVLVWLLSGGVCSTSPINSTEWEAVGGFVITICKPWYTYVRMKLTQTPWPKHPVLHTCVLSDNFLLLYATAQSPTKSLSYVYHTLNNKLL